MRISVYLSCFLFTLLLLDCKHSTEPVSPGMSGFWSGNIDNNAMQLTLADNNNLLTGQISWQRNDTSFVNQLSNLSKIVADSVFILIEPVFMFYSPLYLTGKISGTTIAGTYHAVSSSVGLSPSGSWNATKTR